MKDKIIKHLPILFILILLLALIFPFLCNLLSKFLILLNRDQNLVIYYGLVGDIGGGLIGAAIAVYVLNHEFKKSRDDKIASCRGFFQLNYIKNKTDVNILLRPYLYSEPENAKKYLTMNLCGNENIFDCKVRLFDRDIFPIGLVVPKQFVIIPICDKPTNKTFEIAITYRTIMNEWISHRLKFANDIEDMNAKETMYSFLKEEDMESGLKEDIDTSIEKTIKTSTEVFRSESRLFEYPIESREEIN
jgi:hypothetical protein